jgi:hypothetical protein
MNFKTTFAATGLAVGIGGSTEARAIAAVAVQTGPAAIGSEIATADPCHLPCTASNDPLPIAEDAR